MGTATWTARTTGNSIVGSITANITRTSNSAGESALGDVIADAQLEYTQPAAGQLAVRDLVRLSEERGRVRIEPDERAKRELGERHVGRGRNSVTAHIAQHHGDKVPVYIYEGAGHGFNNESPERYNAEAADLARHRTLELFDEA